MADPSLLVDIDGALATITINRPKVLNALNAEVIEGLQQALDELGHADDVRVLIVTGSGDRAFVAGADIKELAVQTPTSGKEHALRGQRVLEAIETLGKPVIAAINGYALGGGCELAMACTLRIAADTAKLGQPEINLGLIPGYAGTQRLVRLVGPTRAMDLVLTGRQITAEEAAAIGLVTRVVPAADLMAEVRAVATELASKAPVAVRYAIEAITVGRDMPFAHACLHEATLFGLIASTDDMREGTSAFLEKRKPSFKGT